MLWKEHWISLKWCQYLSLLFLTLVIKRNLYIFLFPDCLRLISGNFRKKFIKVFWYLDFFYLLNFNKCKETTFSSKFSFFFFFDSCLMLKVLKLQIISDSNVNKKNLTKIMLNYPRITHHENQA